MPAPLQTGTLLVASQDLQESTFNRTVILLIHHSEVDGAMGLVLNRPIGDQVKLDSSEELHRFVQSGPAGSNVGHLFFAGGPMRRGYLFYMHRLNHVITGGAEILDNLYLGGDLDAVRAEAEVIAADAPMLRFYLGYAGWEKKQLENEIELGAWILVPGGPDLVFSAATGDMWHDVLYSLGGKYRALAELPEDPAVN